MIIDLGRFATEEKRHWDELDAMLDKLESEPLHRLSLEETRRFHYLYQRAAADLAKVATFTAEPEMRRYLENLVSRAYAEIHSQRERSLRFSPWRWFFVTFPQTFRRHARLCLAATLLMLFGSLLGALFLHRDEEAKAIIMPFPHLLGDPSDRVAREEERAGEHMAEGKTRFAAMLMTHNTRVSITTLALGFTWGIGTGVILFYNGVILGAVSQDYLAAGEGVFLAAWLLPHGSVEIPAILIAGQAGLLIGITLVGRGRRAHLRQRFREVSGDLATLIGGVAVLLVWAGIVEAFFSQYHYPVLPYWLKIVFGVVQIGLLAVFLARSGLSQKSVDAGAEREVSHA